MPDQLSMEEQADTLERQQLEELGNRVVGKSLFYFLSDGEQTLGDGFKQGPGQTLLMGEDPRLPAMPDAPTLTSLNFALHGPGHTSNIFCRVPTLHKKMEFLRKWFLGVCFTISLLLVSFALIMVIGAHK